MGSLSARTASLVAVLGLGAALNCGPVLGREDIAASIAARRAGISKDAVLLNIEF